MKSSSSWNPYSKTTFWLGRPDKIYPDLHLPNELLAITINKLASDTGHNLDKILAPLAYYQRRTVLQPFSGTERATRTKLKNSPQPQNPWSCVVTIAIELSWMSPPFLPPFFVVWLVFQSWNPMGMPTFPDHFPSAIQAMCRSPSPTTAFLKFLRCMAPWAKLFCVWV